ncbi:purine-cytosine permease [Flammula alnicola]|nr:purine-cytosine permease [Flammula alnicola]
MAEDTKETAYDSEKQVGSVTTVEVASTFRGWTQQLTTWGVEMRGIQPVPVEERTDTQYSKICFVFLSSNMNILAFSIGTLGPVVFELSVRDSCLVIIGFNLICTIFPAYFATWGPNMGMRQMVLARYTFGYYGVIIPCVLNLVSVIGFSVSNCILGGQALASVTNGHLSWTVGIVIFTAISVVVSFCGYKFLNWYERVAWIPVVITFIIVLGIGGKHLGNPPPPVPPTAASILGFAGTQAGYMITWSGFAADYASYLRPDGASWKVFWYSYIGLFLPTVLLACVGAALSAAANSVPAWNDGYAGGNIGGLLEAVLQPAGNFGKFLTVILSLSVAANLVSIFYSASFNFQVFIPRLVVVPRYVFTVVTAAVVLPISIVGAHRFYAAVTNFLSLIGYWCSAFVVMILIEHLYFRSNKFTNYDSEAWNVPSRLPLGLAAVGSGVLSFALVIPCVSQVWFTGPIAKTTGDLGFEVAFVLNAILYPPLRWLEIRFTGRL